MDHQQSISSFTLNNGRLVPIVLTGGRWFCQFGATAAQGMVLINGQPQCPANTPVVDALNVIPQPFIDPIAPSCWNFSQPAPDTLWTTGF